MEFAPLSDLQSVVDKKVGEQGYFYAHPFDDIDLIAGELMRGEPLPTENLLEGTDGLRRPPPRPPTSAIHQYPLDAAACDLDAVARDLLLMLSCAILMTSSQLQGHATVASEILEDCPDADIILVCCGGGGLVSGCAAAVKLRGANPGCQVIAVEPEGAPTMFLSLKEGAAQRLDTDKYVFTPSWESARARLNGTGTPTSTQT